jgi:DUF1016 N-terminal domain
MSVNDNRKLMGNFEGLVFQITEAHKYFHDLSVRQVNHAFTLRNWLIGMWLVEYEQNGLDRATYGQGLYKNLSDVLRSKRVKGMSFTFLHTCKQFYNIYPQIVQSLAEEFKVVENQYAIILQTLSEELKVGQIQSETVCRNCL